MEKYLWRGGQEYRSPRVSDRNRTNQSNRIILINFENPISIITPKNSYVNQSAQTEDDYRELLPMKLTLADLSLDQKITGV